MSQHIRLLKRPEVLARIGLKTTKLYKMLNAGTFPKPIQIGRDNLWPNTEIDAWIAEQIADPSLTAQLHPAQAPAPVQLLPRPDVLARIGLKTTKLYEMMSEGTFPRPIKVGRSCLWPSTAVDAWIAEQMTKPRLEPRTVKNRTL